MVVVLVPTLVVDFAVGTPGSLKQEQFYLLLYFVSVFALSTIVARVSKKNVLSGAAGVKATLRMKLIRKFTTLESVLMEKEGRDEVRGERLQRGSGWGRRHPLLWHGMRCISSFK